MTSEPSNGDILTFIAMFMCIGVLIGAMLGKEGGKELENKRLYSCLTSPEYSGVAWIGDDKLFTCSSDIKKGKVYYNKKGAAE